MSNPTVELLNKLLRADPLGTEYLLQEPITVDEADLDDVNVFVREENGECFLTGLGIINGILEANNLPRVAAVINEEKDSIVKFQAYRKGK